jgi:hypothetical protein
LSSGNTSTSSSSWTLGPYRTDFFVIFPYPPEGSIGRHEPYTKFRSIQLSHLLVQMYDNVKTYSIFQANEITGILCTAVKNLSARVLFSIDFTARNIEIMTTWKNIKLLKKSGMYKLKLTLEKKHRLLIVKKSHRDKVISVINIASPEELQRPAISIYMQYYARLGHRPTRKNSHPSKKK